MASRIFWVFIAGLALVTGMVLQDGPHMWSWAADTGVSASTQKVIESKVDEAIDRSFDKIDTVESDGREIPLSPEMKRAMAAAVGEFVKAETDYAMTKATDGSEKAIEAARARRYSGGALKYSYSGKTGGSVRDWRYRTLGGGFCGARPTIGLRCQSYCMGWPSSPARAGGPTRRRGGSRW